MAHHRHYLDHVQFHERPELNTCAHCGEKFEEHRQMLKHKRYVQCNVPMPAKPDSFLSFFLPGFRLHGPYHDSHCAECGHQVLSWEEHQKHVELEHGGRWRHKCGLCGTSFAEARELRSHRVAEHRREAEQEFCHVCGKHVRGLRAHLRSVHHKEPMACHICGGLYRHRRALEAHIRYINTGTGFLKRDIDFSTA